MRFSSPKSLPSPMNDIFSSPYSSPSGDPARTSPNSANKAKEKWQQRGGTGLYISPTKSPSRSLPGRKRCHESEPPIGVDHRNCPKTMVKPGHQSSKPYSISEHRYSVVYHAPVVVDTSNFVSIHIRTPRSCTIGVQSKHSTLRRPQYMRSGFRYKSPKKRNGAPIDFKRRDSPTGLKTLRGKRKRAIFSHGLGDFFGKVKSIGEKIREKDRKRRARAKREYRLKLDKMSESSNDDAGYMQLSTPTTEVQDMAMFQLDEEPRSRFDWKTCISMFPGSWRDRRGSADSVVSVMIGSAVTNSQSVHNASCARPNPSLSHDPGFESDHDEYDDHTPNDENPFETPLPSATLSVVSMASIDSDDSFSDMDFLPEGAGTPIKTDSTTQDSMLMMTSNLFPSIKVNVNREKRVKLGRFFGPEVLRYC